MNAVRRLRSMYSALGRQATVSAATVACHCHLLLIKVVLDARSDPHRCLAVADHAVLLLQAEDDVVFAALPERVLGGEAALNLALPWLVGVAVFAAAGGRAVRPIPLDGCTIKIFVIVCAAFQI